MNSTNTRKKTFDCVAFKRESQLRIYEDIKGMTRAQEIEYFRREAQSGPLGDLWKRLKKAQSQRQKV